MPVTLTDDPNSFPDLVVPDGASARDAITFATPLQQVANRTRQTKNRLDLIAPSTDGIRALRTVASLAALRAIGAVDHTDNSYAVVEDLGVYRYDIDSLQTPLDPVVVQPTDVVGAGTPGRWHLVAIGKGCLGIANGIAQCDSTGRIPAASVRSGIVFAGSAIGGNNTAGPANLFTPIALGSLLVGDIIFLEYSVTVVPAAGHEATITAVVNAPVTGDDAVPGTVNIIDSPATGTIQLSGQLRVGAGHHVVANAGAHTATVFVQTDGTTANFLNCSMNVRVVRP
jgi:hypothetical protein